MTASSPAPPSSSPPAGAHGGRRGGFAHRLAVVRSLTYAVFSALYFFTCALVGAWMLLLPQTRMRRVVGLWARGDLWLLRVIVGQRMRVLGGENIPREPALVAAKHQCAWETVALLPLVPRSTVILKHELMRIPVLGVYLRHFRMIAVDRSAGPAALKQLDAAAREAVEAGLSIIIFPEGTRRPVGAPPDYKPGALFLYERLNVPMVPVAHNAGLLWPQGSLARYPGTITVSFLPPIAPGLGRAAARAALIEAIETETGRLVALGTAGGDDRGPGSGSPQGTGRSARSAAARV